MSILIKHSFPSGKLDGPDPTVVRPRDWNDEHDLSGSGWLIAGMVIDYIGHTVPSYLLEAYGQSVAASTYPLLYSALVRQATVTFTNGTPGVVNWVDHGLTPSSKVRFKTTGALPVDVGTGAPLVANQDYYVLALGFSTAAFSISHTIGGTAIAFTGTSSGTHTAVNAEFGASSDLTTFTVPDLRGRVTAGLDTMGGTPANRLTGTAGGVSGAVVGGVGGSQGHVLTTPELAAHQHNNNPPDPTVSLGGLIITVNAAGGHTHANSLTITGASIGAGGGHSHTLSGNTGDDTPDHANLVNGRIYGSSYGGAGSHAHGHTIAATFNPIAHVHGMTQYEEWNKAAATGTHRVIQHNDAGGGTASAAATSSAAATGTVSISGGIAAAGAHEHSVYVDANFWSGGANTRHHHPLGGTATAVADHTHPLVGGTIGGTINAVADHTHTAVASGTAASTQADYLSDVVGANAAHNNVQPTFIVRKLIYVG